MRPLSEITIGESIPVIPITPNISKILDPIKFPKEIFCSLLIIATIEVDSSGILVPKAIIVTPIILSLIPRFEARLIAPFINTSDPNHRKKPPKFLKISCFYLH